MTSATPPASGPTAFPSRTFAPLRVFAFNLSALVLLAFTASAASIAPPKPDRVVLDAVAVQNLRIQTAVAEPAVFEETVFALGRLDVYPGRRAVISSRVPGRALEVFVTHDHPVKKGDVALTVESRQFGEPPPVLELTAPISGLVSATHVVPGEPVSPDKVLAEILDLSDVYAIARVPEHVAGRIKPGQEARIVVPAAGHQTWVAKLEHFGALADPENGTVEAAFHVPNPDFVLRPGMRAEFSIVVARREEVVAVPRSALQGDPASRFVYVKDFDLPHTFLKTPVVVGQSNDRVVEIVRGLFPADEVVTSGAYSLAFAGAGTVSLKAALDAAHGHEHNPDGSEKNAASAKKPTDDHAHHDHDDHAHSPLWMIVSALLFLALLVVTFLKQRPPAA